MGIDGLVRVLILALHGCEGRAGEGRTGPLARRGCEIVWGPVWASTDWFAVYYRGQWDGREVQRPTSI